MIYALLSLNFLGAINELFLPIFLARKVDLANFSAVIIKLGISQVTREEFVKAFLRWTEDDTHYTIIIFFTTKAIINIAIIINNVLNSPFQTGEFYHFTCQQGGNTNTFFLMRWEYLADDLERCRLSNEWKCNFFKVLRCPCIYWTPAIYKYSSNRWWWEPLERRQTYYKNENLQMRTFWQLFGTISSVLLICEDFLCGTSIFSLVMTNSCPKLNKL